MLPSAIKAVVGIFLILGGWLLVQSAWRRVFPGTPADEDVLAGRLGCHQCSCRTPCDQLEGAARESGLRKAPHSDR